MSENMDRYQSTDGSKRKNVPTTSAGKYTAPETSVPTARAETPSARSSSSSAYDRASEYKIVNRHKHLSGPVKSFLVFTNILFILLGVSVILAIMDGNLKITEFTNDYGKQIKVYYNTDGLFSYGWRMWLNLALSTAGMIAAGAIGLKLKGHVIGIVIFS